MSKMTMILQGLINRTQEGKLPWEITANSDTFVASVDTTAIIIRMVDGFLERHRLEILNDKGKTAVVVETDDTFGTIPKEILATPEQTQDLRRLFVLARQSALDADSTLEKLARDLERIG